jgi:hypothetical protein
MAGAANAGVSMGMVTSVVAANWGAAMCSGALLGRPWGVMLVRSPLVFWAAFCNGALDVEAGAVALGAAMCSGALGRPWGIMLVRSPLVFWAAFCNGALDVEAGAVALGAPGPILS